MGDAGTLALFFALLAVLAVLGRAILRPASSPPAPVDDDDQVRDALVLLIRLTREDRTWCQAIQELADGKRSQSSLDEIGEHQEALFNETLAALRAAVRR